MYISLLFLTYHELYKKARGSPRKDEKISQFGIKLQKKEQIVSKINTILRCNILVDFNKKIYIIHNQNNKSLRMSSTLLLWCASTLLAKN